MRKKLLFISSVWVEPNSSAAGSRMVQLIELFQENNFEIHYATTASSSDFCINLSKINVFSHQIEINNNSFDDFIVNLNPVVVVFDRFMLEEQFGWRVAKYCPNALRILDTEDLHCLRLAREECIKNNQLFSINYLKQCSVTKREIASIYRCDISLIISDFEMDLLKNNFHIAENLLLYLPLFAKKNNVIIPFEERNDFVFIGNFLHKPNCDAVEELSKKIWQSIHNKLPNTKMQIYGAYTSQKIVALHKPQNGFIINGRAENALEVLSKAKLLIAPIRYGAGIKGKIVDAMQVGTPVVTTAIGAEGINYNALFGGCIEDNVDEFTAKAVTLYNDKLLWEKYQKTEFEILEKKFSKKLFENHFKRTINNILENISFHRNDNFIGSILGLNTTNSYYYMSKWIEEKNKNLQ